MGKSLDQIGLLEGVGNVFKSRSQKAHFICCPQQSLLFHFYDTAHSIYLHIHKNGQCMHASVSFINYTIRYK